MSSHVILLNKMNGLHTIYEYELPVVGNIEIELNNFFIFIFSKFLFSIIIVIMLRNCLQNYLNKQSVKL